MEEIILLKYFAFGYSWVVYAISFVLNNDLRNPKIFRKCFSASIISFGTGIIFELTNIFKIETGMTCIIMSSPIIYLGIYCLLFRIFENWNGFEPYFTTRGDRIGGDLDFGFWVKFPRDRKILWTDFFYSFLVFVLPMLTITLFISLLRKFG